MIIIELIKEILGIILFLLPGFLLSYLLFTQVNIIERTVYTIGFALSFRSIMNFLLSQLNISSFFTGLSIYSIFIIFILIIFWKKTEKIKTNYHSDIFYILGLSFISIIWQSIFYISIKNFHSAYDYAVKFKEGMVPDLGFYTGMALNHSYYIPQISNSFFDFLNNSIATFNISSFLNSFLYLGIIYIVCNLYTKNKYIIYFTISILALGPIEIFLSTKIEFITLISLFLLYRSKEKDIFGNWVFAFSLCLLMASSYYTSTMVNLLASAGFILAILIYIFITQKDKREIKLYFNSIFKNKLIWAFTSIIIISLILLIVLTQMFSFTIEISKETFRLTKKSDEMIITQDTPPAKSEPTTESITKPITEKITYPEYKLQPYKDEKIFGISAIGWQSAFLLFCGMTFVIYVLYNRKKITEGDLHILLSIIPVAIVSFAFYYTGYQTRFFNYFAFFALMSIKIPKKYFRTFFIISFMFILISGYKVLLDKSVLFSKSDLEIRGSEWATKNLTGKIFSDQEFINLLILREYNKVDGIADLDPRLGALFYNNDRDLFLKTIKNLNVDYIAVSKRMREKYILMVDTPQIPITNESLFNTLDRVYDNGDVTIYDARI